MRFPDLLSKINRMQDEIDSLKVDLNAIFPEARAYWRRQAESVPRETAQDPAVGDAQPQLPLEVPSGNDA